MQAIRREWLRVLPCKFVAVLYNHHLKSLLSRRLLPGTAETHGRLPSRSCRFPKKLLQVGHPGSPTYSTPSLLDLAFIRKEVPGICKPRHLFRRVKGVLSCSSAFSLFPPSPQPHLRGDTITGRILSFVMIQGHSSGCKGVPLVATAASLHSHSDMVIFCQRVCET